MSEEISEEELEIREALKRQGTSFLLENEIVNTDLIINDLILAGFTAHKSVQDVELYVDEEKKVITFELYFNFLSYKFCNLDKIIHKLNNFVQSGLKNFEVRAIKKRYNSKKTKSETIELQT